MTDTGVFSFAGTERFQILSRLGAGGMGVVYAAHDKEQKTQVAIKVLKDMGALSITRFKREFRALADLAHPNLVRLGELYCELNQWFFTMELLAGDDFIRHVRSPNHGPGGLPISSTEDTQPSEAWDPKARVFFDEARLRSALGQLALGLEALHRARKIHRDVKPSNVLVTPSGRVVLLDFGLIVDSAQEEDSALGLMGTVPYMAPEQVVGTTIGPAADWYAVGAVLYEALTGRPPFEGPQARVLLDKVEKQPERPNRLAAGIPADLNELCLRLLSVRPESRPRAPEILRYLGVGASQSAGPTSEVSAKESVVFVGRLTELQALRAAFHETTDGKSVTLLVHGESGLGKSSLVRHFTEALESERHDVLVLSGRCHERESVPYKALDAIMDTLSRRLAAMDQVEVALLLSARASALVRLFPALRQCEAVSHLPPLTIPDPQEQRSQAFAVLRALLWRLSKRFRLVLCIDDLQWSDDDSLTLLEDVLRPPQAPPLLLVATVQTGAERESSATLSQRLRDVQHLHMDILPMAEARTLTRTLLGHLSPPHGAEVDRIAAEAGGHPLFIQVLTQYLVLPDSQRDAHLDDVFWARISALDKPARRLIEILSVAGAPLSKRQAALGARLDADELPRVVSFLRASQLARSHGTERIELYHNRIRSAVLAKIPEVELRALHGHLATVLESDGAAVVDPMRLVRHLQLAGQRERAALYAEQAAQHATQALAFDRAAELYGMALRLADHTEVEARGLHLLLGNALANAGRGAEAALAFDAAARGSDRAVQQDLSRRAAEQRLLAGHIDHGLSSTRDALSAAGVSLPKHPMGALLSLAALRARLRLRGLGYHSRAEAQVPQSELQRIDTCWSASIGLAFLNPIQGSVVQTRHTLLALKAGEPYRIARSLSVEAAYLACAGRRNEGRAKKLFAQAGVLVEKLCKPQADAYYILSQGVAAMLFGRFREAREKADQADLILREQCAGVAWEIDTAHDIAVTSMVYLGEIRELCQRVPLYLRAAKERGDLYASTNFSTGDATLAWLAADDPKGAFAEALQARDRYSRHAVVIQCYADPLAQTQIDLYEGRGPLAHARLVDRWRSLDKALLLQLQHIRSVMHHLRGTAALAAAIEARETSERKRYLMNAEADARRLAREGVPWTAALAALLGAGVAALRGGEAVPALYGLAAEMCETAGLSMHAAVARLRQGQCEGGDEGRARGATASEWLLGQSIQNPTRWAQMIAPGSGGR